jgi:hypothetical protein
MAGLALSQHLSKRNANTQPIAVLTVISSPSFVSMFMVTRLEIGWIHATNTPIIKPNRNPYDVVVL